MELGILGGSWADLVFGGVLSGGIALLFGLFAIIWWGTDVLWTTKIFAFLSVCLFVLALIMLPIGRTRAVTGTCLTSLPNATYAVEGAFPYEKETMVYAVVSGRKNSYKDAKLISRCVIFRLNETRDFPGIAFGAGEYRLAVEKQEGANQKWNTYIFKPISEKG